MTLIRLNFGFKKGIFTRFSKLLKSFYLLFYVKNYKRMSSAIGYQHKIKQKTPKTVLYSKSKKNMVGRLFGRFFIVFGRFFNRNIWSPRSQIYRHFPLHYGSSRTALTSSGKMHKQFKGLFTRPISERDFAVSQSLLQSFLPLNMLASLRSPAAVLGDLKTRTNLFYLESRSEYLFFTVHKRVFARNVTKRNAKTD